MAEFSDEFKINVNKLNADEAVLVCIEIRHPFISDVIRIVNDSDNLISNGNTYLPMGFEFKRHDDVENELPRCTVTFQNIGRLLTKWVDASGGGKMASFDMLLIRRKNPNFVEERISFEVGQCNVTTEIVGFELIIQNNLRKRAINYMYDLKRAEGLF